MVAFPPNLRDNWDIGKTSSLVARIAADPLTFQAQVGQHSTIGDPDSERLGILQGDNVKKSPAASVCIAFGHKLREKITTSESSIAGRGDTHGTQGIIALSFSLPLRISSTN